MMAGMSGAKDLGDGAHHLLERVLVGAGCLLGLLLGDAAHARDCDEVIVEVVDLVADDDLELAGLREASLGCGKRLDRRHVRDARVDEGEAHARHAVRERGDVLLAADQAEHLAGVAFEPAHLVLLSNDCRDEGRGVPPDLDARGMCSILSLDYFNRMRDAQLQVMCIRSDLRLCCLINRSSI